MGFYCGVYKTQKHVSCTQLVCLIIYEVEVKYLILQQIHVNLCKNIRWFKTTFNFLYMKIIFFVRTLCKINRYSILKSCYLASLLQNSENSCLVFKIKNYGYSNKFNESWEYWILRSGKCSKYFELYESDYIIQLRYCNFFSLR